MAAAGGILRRCGMVALVCIKKSAMQFPHRKSLEGGAGDNLSSERCPPKEYPPQIKQNTISERKPINQMCKSLGAPFSKGADSPMPTLISVFLQ